MPRDGCEPPALWHGVVMAGGAARRFGRDKVFERVGERRMIDAAVASLRDAERITVLLGSPERASIVAGALPPGCAALPDDHPGHGPLGGLATALRLRPDGWTAVLAADLPLVPRSWWPWLAGHHVGGAVAIVPRQPDGRWEPLAALYHGVLGVDVGALVDAATARGLGMQRWLDELLEHGRVVPADPGAMQEEALLNVNRLEDAERVRRRLSST
jgi:molybdenum cofactor guanylyltransferase